MMWTPALLGLLSSAAASPVAKRTTAAQWNALGCVSDLDAKRVLQDRIYVNADNSPDLCVDTCSKKLYTYAGVQCE